MHFQSKVLTNHVIQEKEIVSAMYKGYILTNETIIVLQKEHLSLIYADSFILKLELRINESLKLSRCYMNHSAFAECFDRCDRDKFLCVLEVFPDELEKVKHKSIYGSTGSVTGAS